VAPDLTAAAVQERSDPELAAVIREGRGVMPGFGDQLNDRGIQALVGHVRTLRQP
jgi:mono/diheme cytochrome c family protein